jgi:hypothetical protein
MALCKQVYKQAAGMKEEMKGVPKSVFFQFGFHSRAPDTAP